MGWVTNPTDLNDWVGLFAFDATTLVEVPIGGGTDRSTYDEFAKTTGPMPLTSTDRISYPSFWSEPPVNSKRVLPNNQLL